MNKYKLLGGVLVLSIILSIAVAYGQDRTSIQYAISGSRQFLDFLALLCVTLFGCFAALQLDKKNES